MNKKKVGIIFIAFFVLFFGSIFYRNITTYSSLKSHTGYTFGTIIEVWDDEGSWYSRYQYCINGVTFKGRQGGKHVLQDTVLIVYDITSPRFSMIAEYSLPISLKSNMEFANLDSSIVKFKWWDYLPGDGIHSIKDIWSLE